MNAKIRLVCCSLLTATFFVGGGNRSEPQPHEGNSWFFKITGDAPLVEAPKDAFMQFVKSVKF